MCEFIQYIQRQNPLALYKRGFNRILFSEDGVVKSDKSLTLSDFRFTDKGKNYIPINIINHYEDISALTLSPLEKSQLPYATSVKHKSERDARGIWVAIYPPEFDETCYHLLNPETGEILPLYIKCKCGKCSVCKESKKNSLQSRCYLESCVSNTPLFVTLTYDNEHASRLSFDRDEQVKELQNFFKRIRKQFEKDPDFKMKYVFVSEYGSKFGRLHYHGLIWIDEKHHSALTKLVYSGPVVYPEFAKNIEKAWNFGYVKVMLAKDKTGKYVSKYMCKGRNTIKLQSQKIGYEQIYNDISFLRENPSISKWSVANPFTGEIKDISIYSYVINLTYPSICRQVPLEIRECAEQFMDCFKKVPFDEFFQFWYNQIYKELEFLGYSYENYTFKEEYVTHLSYLESYMGVMNYARKIKEFFKGKDIEFMNTLAKLNKQHTSFIMTNISDDNTQYSASIRHSLECIIENDNQ